MSPSSMSSCSFFWLGRKEKAKKGEWVYMTATYDGKNTIQIYENGKELGKKADVGKPPPQDTSEVHIAGWQGNTSELLDGLLDEVAVFTCGTESRRYERPNEKRIQGDIGCSRLKQTSNLMGRHQIPMRGLTSTSILIAGKKKTVPNGRHCHRSTDRLTELQSRGKCTGCQLHWQAGSYMGKDKGFKVGP